MAITRIQSGLIENAAFNDLFVAILDNTFNDLVDHGRSLVASPTVIADEFEDSAGIDAVNSTGETYDATGFVTNNATYGSNVAPSAPSATATSEFSAAYAAEYLWDGNTGTAWVTSSGTGSNYIDFGSGNDKEIIRALMAGDGANGPTQIDFAYSDNASSWTDVLTNEAFSASNNYDNDYSWTSVGAHRYWRVNVDSRLGSGGMWFRDIQLFEPGSSQDMDLRSVGVTMASTPTSGFFVGKFSQSDPDTVYASSDGGSTWDTVTLTDYGDYGTGQSLFAGPVTLTGGGTDVRLRAVKASGTECRVEAWGLVAGQ